jgi:hypothetical protein
MQEVALIDVPCMTPAEVARTRKFGEWLATQPAVDIPTSHVIHAGMYHRTCMIPANAAVTGALIKIPTVMTFHGAAHVYTGEEFIFLRGYHVLAAAAGRAQVVIAVEDTYVTMSFPTDKLTVDECEQQFTDEYEQLGSRRSKPCQDG